MTASDNFTSFRKNTSLTALT